MRPIDADELRDHKFNDETADYRLGWNCAIDAIVENAPTIGVHAGWVPTSLGLMPERDWSVLTIVSGKPTENITLRDAYELASYDEEGWCLQMWPEWTGAEVSYWMYLPDPPKEESHD